MRPAAGKRRPYLTIFPLGRGAATAIRANKERGAFSTAIQAMGTRYTIVKTFSFVAKLEGYMNILFAYKQVSSKLIMILFLY